MDTFNCFLHLHTFGTQYNTFKFIMRQCYSASHISWFLLLFFLLCFSSFNLVHFCVWIACYVDIYLVLLFGNNPTEGGNYCFAWVSLGGITVTIQ